MARQPLAAHLPGQAAGAMRRYGSGPMTSPGDSAQKTEAGIDRIVPIASDLRIGTTLASYRLESIIGRGGMGVVYLAEHVHLHRKVALKLLVPDLMESEDFRERFIRESRIAASIHHPNIVTVYDAGEADGLLFIAMHYVQGTDMAKLLQSEGPLELSRAISLLGQVASALDVAHSHGIVHRDVKPGNVMMEGEHCYLTDFGLTKRLSSNTGLTGTGMVGTLDYMSPEQIEGSELDGTTDVYALGCLAYHALSGAVPFQKDSDVSVMYAHLHEPLPELSGGLDPEVHAVIARAMAKRREDRFPTCGNFIAALRLIGVESYPGTPVTEPPATADTARAKVLIAAEEATLRAMIRASLSGGRLDVLEASDRDGALSLARSERPDLLVADWGMPHDAGAEICRAVRDDPEAAHTKIIAVTTKSQGGERAALAEAGADDYIARPFSPLQLLFKVRSLMGPEVLEP
jgi:serine/threonine protein kinase